MTSEEFFNDPISVTASIDSRGQIVPTSMNWQGKTYAIVTIGRQWEAEDGRHVLIETAGGDRFEIQLSRLDLLWHLQRAWRNQLTA